MAQFFSINKYNNVFICIVCIIFQIALIKPPIYAFDVGINDVNCGLKLKKLSEKVLKFLEKKEINRESLLNVLLDYKSTVESLTGQYFDLEYQIDQVQQEAYKKGHKISGTDLKNYKKYIKNYLKKKKDKTACMEAYLNDKPDIDFDDFERLCVARDRNGDPMHNELVPFTVYAGISLMLIGGFSMMVSPLFPPALVFGETCMGTGYSFLLCEGVTQYNEKYNK